MPKMHIDKSIVINAPVDKIFSTLNDFNHWTSWSPWLLMDPDAKVTVAEDAKSYEWEGKRVGSGNMQILAEEANKSIDYNLTFLTPWKSKAKVKFLLHENGEGVEVSWLMDSNLPFFLFWMKKMMTAFVGMDYERGLKMLKEIVEDGEVKSKLEFKGTSEFPATQYVGISSSCSIDGLSSSMMTDFGKLEAFMKDNEELRAGAGFSIYHKWDMVKNKVSYTGGVPVKSVPENLPEGIISDEIPATKVYTLRHIGSYNHLGNAWTTLYGMERGKEIKCNKGIHPFETYVNSPEEVAEKELITDINFPLK